MQKKGIVFTMRNLYVAFLFVYLLCLPLNAMNIGAFGSALKVLSVLPIGVAILATRKLHLHKPELWQILFTAFAGTSILWSINVEKSVSRTSTYLLLLLLLLTGVVFKITEKDLGIVKQAMVWSSRATAVVTFIFADYYQGRLMLLDIIQEDPNYLSAYYAFGIVFALEVLVSRPRLWRKLLAVGELGAYFYLVLASGSRGGLLAIAAAAVAYLLTFDFSFEKGKIASFFKKLFVLALAVGLLLLLLQLLPEYLRNRFTLEDVAESGGSGRTELWAQAWQVFMDANPLRKIFGYGTATIFSLFEYYNFSRPGVAHNIFLETLVELGIVGLVIYTTAILAFLISAFRKKDKFAFAVVFGLIVLSLSTSIYTFKPYFNIMLYVILASNVSRIAGKNTEES